MTKIDSDSYAEYKRHLDEIYTKNGHINHPLPKWIEWICDRLGVK